MAEKHVARSAAKFVRHVVPAAVKPIHSLWHEIIGFVFLAVAAIMTAGAFRSRASLGPGKLVFIVPFIVLAAGYGISSFLKARRISRS